FADRSVFIIAPAIVFVTVLLSFTVVPFGSDIDVLNLNVGLLFFLGMSSLGVYSVVLGGWASDNKYALLGSIRAEAEMISVEFYMGIARRGVVLMSGWSNIREIVCARDANCYVAPQFLGFVTFFLAGLAETRRLPFDRPEAENEILSGFHSEYSGM